MRTSLLGFLMTVALLGGSLVSWDCPCKKGKGTEQT
jgi:hypothetical protein